MLKAATRYREEIRENGLKRIFIKSAKPVSEVPMEKWFGLLKETQRLHEPWYTRFGTDLEQAIPRLITRAFFKRSYDTAIFSAIEKRLLKPGLTLTLPVKLVAGYVTFPLTTWGLIDHFLTKKEKDKIIENLDFQIQHDYRFKWIKDEMLLSSDGQTISDAARETARAKALELIGVYELYDYQMKEFHKSGIEFHNPELTRTLFTDPYLSAKLKPLFSDVYSLTHPEFYQRTDFRFEGERVPTPQSTHQITEIAHLRIMTQNQIKNLIENTGSINPALKESFFNDPFIKSLLKLREEGKLSTEEVEYWAGNNIEWKSRFKQWKILKATPLQRINGEVTSEPLTLEIIEHEQLQMINKIKH